MSDKPNFFMIVLEGGGDVTVKIVDEETFDWLDSPRPKMVDYGAEDKSCPESVRQRAYKEYLEAESRWPSRKTKPYEDFWPDVTSGSCENDRALFVAALTIDGEQLEFDTVSEAANWCVEHGVKIAESWEGYIY